MITIKFHTYAVPYFSRRNGTEHSAIVPSRSGFSNHHIIPVGNVGAIQFNLKLITVRARRISGYGIYTARTIVKV